VEEANSEPDYVYEVEAQFPGTAEEYSALKWLSRHLLANRRRGDLEHTVLLQCGIAWQHYHAILLLLANGFGVQSLILSRTLFELVVNTLYLLGNPALLPDFLDYSKINLYRQAVAAGIASEKLASIATECEQIRTRFEDRKGNLSPWHHSTIKKMAMVVRLDVYYDKFYTDACGAGHADSTKLLTPGTRGWRNDLRRFVDEIERDFVHYSSFQLIGWLYFEVTRKLELGHETEAKAVMLLVMERAKAALAAN
jgi:hypothetical protein